MISFAAIKSMISLFRIITLGNGLLRKTNKLTLQSLSTSIIWLLSTETKTDAGFNAKPLHREAKLSNC